MSKMLFNMVKTWKLNALRYKNSNHCFLYDPNVYSVVVFPVFENGTGTINGTNVTTNCDLNV